MLSVVCLATVPTGSLGNQSSFDWWGYRPIGYLVTHAPFYGVPRYHPA